MAVLLFAFNGCGDDSSEIQSNVITENDLFVNPQIKATHEDTMVIFLEHPDGEGHDNDIGVKGVDEVSVYYDGNVNHTFCWEDDTLGAVHKMELIDISGNTVLTEHINGECATATITAGYYTMRFTHGGQSEGTQAIFTRPVEDISSRGIVSVSSVEDNIHTLLTTNSCIGCDLHDAKLIGANLRSADLTGAILIGAKLIGANLSDANLSDAILAYADLYRAYLRSAILAGANLRSADLTGATLSDANLRSANMRDANLSGANLSNTDLFYADLSSACLIEANLYHANLTQTVLYHANLTKANLTGAIMTNTSLHYAELSGATWTDGSTCAEGSIGSCIH
jgi:uncharacterized protein YjbI with pentapeptide repeats